MKFTLLKDYNGQRKGEVIEVSLAFVDILKTNGYIGDAEERKVPAAAAEKKTIKNNV